MPPTPFTHTPRPAWCAEAPHDWQRRYGAGPLDYKTRARGCSPNYASVDLLRNADENVAQVCAYFSSLNGLTAEVAMKLTPIELRDLARRLIDAAHDIEAYPAEVLQKVAA